jgi:putative ABC transport system ATP-binding protein
MAHNRTNNLATAPQARENDPAIIRLQSVSKVYRTAAGDVTALKDITAEFRRGEFVGIVGKSGAGKSTLVNMITGIDHISDGQVQVDGISIHEMNEDQAALWRGQKIGVIFQSFELLPQLSLIDNVMLPMDFCGTFKPRKSLQRAKHLLTQVGLEEHMQKPPTKISGGQQQRVAIARALANDPAIIVADEPTGNLDSATAEDIMSLFESLVREGKTIVMVTHDRSHAARFSRTIEIADGELVDSRYN